MCSECAGPLHSLTLKLTSQTGIDQECVGRVVRAPWVVRECIPYINLGKPSL